MHIFFRNLSMMEGYMLKSVLAEFRRTGLEEASFSGVRPHKKYPVVPLSRGRSSLFRRP